MQQYSQNDRRWELDKLGTSNNTLEKKGCTITAIAMLLSHYGYTDTPRDVNNRLKEVHGFFDKSLVIWAKVAEAYPKLTFIKRDWEYNNKVVRENVPCLVEVDPKLQRTAIKHWVLYIGNQKMIDPWTGRICKTSKYKATGYALFVPSSKASASVNKISSQLKGQDEVIQVLREQNEAITKKYNDVKNQADKANNEVQRLTDSLAKVRTVSKEINAEKEGEEVKSKEIEKSLIKIASLLSCTNDVPTILGEISKLVKSNDDLRNDNSNWKKNYENLASQKQDEIQKLKQTVAELEIDRNKLSKDLNMVKQRLVTLESIDVKPTQPVKVKMNKMEVFIIFAVSTILGLASSLTIVGLLL